MFAALLNSVVHSSESNHALQNRLLTETMPEQTSSLPPTTLGELATEATQTTQNTQAVHDWLGKIQRRAHRDRRLFWGLFAFFQAFLFVPIALSNTFLAMSKGHFNLAWLALMFLPPFGMAALGLLFTLKKPDWNAEELTRVGGVEAVGTLLELLGTPKRPRQMKPLFVALIHLLPQMKASDAALLTAGQRKLLYALLKSGLNVYANPDLLLKYRLAVVKALEQIGDADAIPLVEHLANGKARTAHQKALKAAAMECLPLLRANCSDGEATKT